MPVELDDNSLRIIGNNFKAVKFYDDNRVLRAEIYLDAQNRLNVGDMTIGTSTTGGGGAGTDLSTVPFLVLSTSDLLSTERVITLGPGLSPSDGGANGAYTIGLASSLAGDGLGLSAGVLAVNNSVARNTWQVNAGNGLSGGGALSASGITLALASSSAGAGLTYSSGVLAVGAGDGVSVGADSVAVDSSVARNTWQVNAGNGLSGGGALSASGITLSLASSAAGNGLTYTTGVLAVGAGNGITVASDDVAVNQGFAFTWTNTHTFQATATMRHIIPEVTDTYDVGSSTRLWRKGWFSELDAVLFAQNVASLIGGWLIIGKGEGALPADVTAVATTIDFGTASVATGDFIVLRSGGQVEYIQIGTVVSGTTRNVSRNLDGSGANAWPAGSVFLVLGQSGDGRIELNASDSPRVQVITQGATYNAQTELCRLGDLNGGWGYSGATWGLALGEYAASKPNITIDTTNGLRIRTHTTTVLQFDTSGNADLSNKLRMPGASSAIAIGATPPTASNAGTGIWIDRTGFYSLLSNTYQVKIDASTGKLYAGGGNMYLDENGPSVVISSAYAATRAYRFVNGSGAVQALLQCYDQGGGATETQLLTPVTTNYHSRTYITSEAPSNKTAETVLQAYVATRTAIQLRVTDNFNGGGDVGVFIGGAGLKVGGYTGSVADGNIVATGSALLSGGLCLSSYTTATAGDIRTPGGLYAGRDADPGDGNVAYAGALKSYKNSTEYTGYAFVPLTTPLTSTSWDGDSYSTTSKTLIDLSVVFGAPAGIKAALFRTAINDSGSSTNICVLLLSPNNTANSGPATDCTSLSNDTVKRDMLVVPCDSNGDVYYQVIASGASTLDARLEIWGYWI